MDRYHRVEKPREEEAPIGANEIRITAQGRPRNYITYALALLQVRPRHTRAYPLLLLDPLLPTPLSLSYPSRILGKGRKTTAGFNFTYPRRI